MGEAEKGDSLGHIARAIIPLLALEVEAMPVEGDAIADSRPLGGEVVGDAHLGEGLKGGGVNAMQGGWAAGVCGTCGVGGTGEGAGCKTSAA